jgi:hypothetical protein
MKTMNQNEKPLRTIEEQRADKQAWQRPTLKVLPVECARKNFGSTPDGVYTS